jgi:hypothetical protein
MTASTPQEFVRLPNGHAVVCRRSLATFGGYELGVRIVWQMQVTGSFIVDPDVYKHSR